MRMILRYESGQRVEALLLAGNSDRMRVAIGARADTVELRVVNGHWSTDEGAAVEVESLIAIPGADVARFCAAMLPPGNAADRALTAG
jgi:hypothetical protein